PARQQQYLEIIMEQTSQLEVLISDLLDVSRIQSGRLTLRPASINITQLCQRIVQVIQGRERVQTKEKFHFRCTFAPDLPHIWADAQRVQQVITNLIENAVKYSPNGGLIEVIVSARRAFQGLKEPSEENENLPGKTRSPLMVHITVRDQGIGIARHQQTRLFKPFSRLEHPLTTEVPGTGLGLYITRRLVEAMGGGVILRSAEGRGTSITFTLPAIHPDEAASPLAFTSTISGDANALTLEKINWPVPDNA
ncbi:MAG TPA: HAMP domain-containing sensor histidine kinase, partial [Ktedonobacteraceae bacterium]|nr:HAMP domain-containing sensor histidine kinase [Ktedonobacteraceae bacterium]